MASATIARGRMECDRPLKHEGQPHVSVVIPTYREADNLDELVTRVSETLDALEEAFEIIIVDDDSQDGTDQVVERLRQMGHPIRLITRVGERGLSTAVLRGFREARGLNLVCMDADLSHPPEALAELLTPLRTSEAEFVVGSRYVDGASTDEQWSWFRRLNSQIATWLARPFTNLRDPMAGFFALPRQVFERGKEWDPVGYKIGLEILVKSDCRRTREVPIHFADRRRGNSKLTWRQQRDYLLHLFRLADYKFPTPWRLIKYCAVGLSGAICDLTCYGLMLAAGIPMELARAVAIYMGMSTNFVGNDRLTFRTSHLDGVGQRYLLFLMTCSLGAVVNYSVALSIPQWLPATAGMPILNAVWGILAGTWFNFWMARTWVFRQLPRRVTGP